MGRGPVRGRLGRRRGAAARDRSGRAEGPAGDARSGGAGILPGRRVPPGLRGDVADPARDDVLGAVPDPPPPRGRPRPGLRPDAHAGGGPLGGRPAERPGAGRPDALDGAALAGGHRLLPLRVRHGLRPLRADLLAGPRAQPGAHASRTTTSWSTRRSRATAPAGVHESDDLDGPPDGEHGRADGGDGPHLRRHGAGGGPPRGRGRPGLPALDDGRLVRPLDRRARAAPGGGRRRRGAARRRRPSRSRRRRCDGGPCARPGGTRRSSETGPPCRCATRE